MAPLAPKPPFATDQPDSFYEQQPQPRLRQPPPPDPNQRTSAYNLYDNYLGDEPESGGNNRQLQVQQPTPDRNSGIGALGMGLLNMGDSDSEDEEDDDIQRKPNSPPGLVSAGLPSKHAMLAATLSPTRANFPPVPVQQPKPQQLPTSQVPSSQPSVTVQVPSQPPSLQSAPYHHVPQPIAAPRPGYAAPIAALNLARAEPSATPVGRMPNPNSPLPLVNNNNPFEPPHAQSRSQYAMSASPAPSTPHPLHPSVTPITPAFIRPSKSPGLHNGDVVNVKFSEGKAIPRKPIMRGNSEETLLPGRGEKGDDFWRRFSMVAKDGSERKESSWLNKMRNRSNRQSRMVWFTGILIVLLIVGGIVLGIILSRKGPSNQQPVPLGGSADSLSTFSSSSAVKTASKPALQPLSTSLHVTPTLTLNHREPAPSPSALAVRLARRFGMREARRLD